MHPDSAQDTVKLVEESALKMTGASYIATRRIEEAVAMLIWGSNLDKAVLNETSV